MIWFLSIIYSNLAIVFGPNLIRPKVETVQGALEMPLLQGIVQILIEQSDRIWGGPPKSRPTTIKKPSLLYVGKIAKSPPAEENRKPASPRVREVMKVFEKLSENNPTVVRKRSDLNNEGHVNQTVGALKSLKLSGGPTSPTPVPKKKKKKKKSTITM